MNREEMRLAAEEMDALKDSGREFEGLERVNAKVSKTPRDVIVLEMSSAEFSEVVEAARNLDQPVDDFIRSAAVAKAREPKSRGAPAGKAPSRGRAPRRKGSAQA
jgi:hypothetical protein